MRAYRYGSVHILRYKKTLCGPESHILIVLSFTWVGYGMVGWVGGSNNKIKCLLIFGRSLFL